MSLFQPETPLLTHQSTKHTNGNTPSQHNDECKCFPFYICNMLPILHPFGQFKMIWDPILILVLIISATEVPFTLVFEISLALDSFFGLLAFSIDIFLCVDILTNFRTAYFDKFDTLHLITSPKHIAIKYLKTWFLFDFITSFPFEFLVINSSEQNVAEYIKIFRILRIVRLLKIARILKMMRVFDKLPQRLSMSPETVIYIKIIKVFFGMVLGAHYIACLWWITGKEMVRRGYDSWLEDVHNNNLYLMGDDYTFLKYTYSYYWSIITLFTTGYGDIVAENVVEVWVSVFAVVIGTVYTSYLIGLATRFVREGDDITQIENKNLKNALIFCEHYDISDKLSHAIESHVRYHHSYNYVLCDAFDDVLHSIPKHLRKEIEIEIASKTLKDIDFLNEFLPLQLIGQIAIKMNCISCNAGHWLYKKNEIGDEFYIQRSGISIIYYHNLYDTIKRGDVIGENILCSNKRKHSIKCVTWSEFYCLTKNDLKQVIYSNYMDGDIIWNKIKNKIKNSSGNKRINVYEKHDANDTIANTEINKETKQIIHDLSHEANKLKRFMHSETPPPYSSLNEMVSNGDNNYQYEIIATDGHTNDVNDAKDKSEHDENVNFEQVEMKPIHILENKRKNATNNDNDGNILWSD